jgi:RNA polymerase subunit RPABC4/transcription elongation factor Spt4
MALINCPDCKAEVSSEASVCPRCGYPIEAVLIEATGKRWKGMQLIFGFMIFIGIIGAAVGIFSSGSSGFVLFAALIGFVGLVGYFVARFKAWWYHG